MRAAIAALALLLSACVAPARSFSAYEGKAVKTAEDVTSAVETARLAVRVAIRDRTFAPTLSVILGEAEKDAGAAQGTFDSVQPPDDRSLELRSKLDELMQPAVSALADLRIAVRSGRLDELQETAEPLVKIGAALSAFSESHS
ncbi:MAG: hypothetical protein ABR548_11280 [Actinomycetota bacterium]|nr:hypothetical protein [Actinomycetota bacterium]